MDFDLITRFLNSIRAEGEERKAKYSDMDPEMADYERLFDRAFLREFYLLVLVFIWHQVEKALVKLAAQADKGVTTPIRVEDYAAEVRRLSKPAARKEIRLRLGIEKGISSQHTVCWDILRPLVNSYKHDPFAEPSQELRNGLTLDPSAKYAPLAESDGVREALCRELGLPKDEQYSGITDAFVRSCSQFLADVKAKARLRPVERR